MSECLLFCGTEQPFSGIHYSPNPPLDTSCKVLWLSWSAIYFVRGPNDGFGNRGSQGSEYPYTPKNFIHLSFSNYGINKGEFMLTLETAKRSEVIQSLKFPNLYRSCEVE